MTFVCRNCGYRYCFTDEAMLQIVKSMSSFGISIPIEPVVSDAIPQSMKCCSNMDLIREETFGSRFPKRIDAYVAIASLLKHGLLVV